MKRLSWAILPALLTGCVVGPNYGGPPGVASGERSGSTFRRADLSIGVQKGPPIGVQKGPPSSSSVTGMGVAPFALVAA
jgi:hypothetical protein